MSKKSAWKIKAEELLKKHHTNKVVDQLFKESGYTRKEFFKKKIQSLNRSLQKPTKSDYKEIREYDGTTSISEVVDRKLSDDELFERYGRKKDEWRISMVWFKDNDNGFLLSCCFVPIKKTFEESISINNNFVDHINKKINVYSKLPAPYQDKKLKPGYILIAKQDAHLNKFDINGNNSIEDRFINFKNKLTEHLNKASKLNIIDKVTYIVGSDEFNSEWTNWTTKGTPQENILTYQDAFEKITEFNIDIINLILSYSNKVDIVLLNGNHDHNVGWHLSNVLMHVFKQNKHRITVDTSINNTKIIEWNQNLLLINHGDAIKPKDLANKFPIIANKQWSTNSNYYVITGDKHHEISHDHNGIICYQVPQLSTSKSSWDDKKVYINSKAEMITFLFEEQGLSNIFKTKM